MLTKEEYDEYSAALYKEIAAAGHDVHMLIVDDVMPDIKSIKASIVRMGEGTPDKNIGPQTRRKWPVPR